MGVFGFSKAARQGQTRRRRRAKLGRPDKGEQLQHVEMTGFAMAAIAEQAVADQGRIGDDQRLASPQLTQFRHRYGARDKAIADVGTVGQWQT